MTRSPKILYYGQLYRSSHHSLQVQACVAQVALDAASHRTIRRILINTTFHTKPNAHGRRIDRCPWIAEGLCSDPPPNLPPEILIRSTQRERCLWLVDLHLKRIGESLIEGPMTAQGLEAFMHLSVAPWGQHET